MNLVERGVRPIVWGLRCLGSSGQPRALPPLYPTSCSEPRKPFTLWRFVLVFAPSPRFVNTSTKRQRVNLLEIFSAFRRGNAIHSSETCGGTTKASPRSDVFDHFRVEATSTRPIPKISQTRRYRRSTPRKPLRYGSNHARAASGSAPDQEAVEAFSRASVGWGRFHSFFS